MAEPPRSERSQPAHAETPKIIYVMGAGRSGSTILGVTLGNCANLFYAGELDNWLMRSGVPQLDAAEQTRFWGRVRDDVDGAAELFGNEASRYLERSMALFRVHGWPARRRLRERYRRIAVDLYRAVTHASGMTYIVDTSHYPLRAHELQQLSDIELYLVYLVRNPQSVVASFNRHDVAQYTKSTLTTNAYLWLTNLLSVLVFLRHPRKRRLFVPYEDFIQDPDGVLRRILDGAGAPVVLPDFSSLKPGIPFQGNRLIKSEVIALTSDAAPPPQRSRITAVLQLPWALVLSLLRPATGTST
jgi:hypothetical protein